VISNFQQNSRTLLCVAVKFVQYIRRIVKRLSIACNITSWYCTRSTRTDEHTSYSTYVRTYVRMDGCLTDQSDEKSTYSTVHVCTVKILLFFQLPYLAVEFVLSPCMVPQRLKFSRSRKKLSCQQANWNSLVDCPWHNRIDHGTWLGEGTNSQKCTSARLCFCGLPTASSAAVPLRWWWWVSLDNDNDDDELLSDELSMVHASSWQQMCELYIVRTVWYDLCELKKLKIWPKKFNQ
jgi:hypothetical protein